MVLTHTTNHAYSHPFPAVTLAYFLRYSSPKLNPFSTHVMSTDTINSHMDPDTGRLHTTRIHLKKSRLPAPIFKLLPTSITGGGSSTDKASYILETSVVDMREGWMRTESRNLNFNNVLSVVEQQNFSLPDKTDQADPSATTNVTTTVVYKSRLGERLRARRDQSATSAAAATTAAEPKEGKVRGEPMRYRLDKDEFSNGMAVVRNNLVQIMADDVLGAREIRRLVVDLVPPRFKAAPTQYEIADRASLNVDQQAAIEKVMTAQDYALVLGMPGTGKTTTIAHIIRALVSQGKSVLLTSYTHTAVDNILLKLKDDSIPVLRLGAPAKVHPEVQEFATLAAVPMHSFDEIKSAWHDPPIVATTCLGIGHHVFNERTFDYCIVDEASQITLPICLGPIRMAKTFVLVGDHNQLPPLVQNEEAREGGLDVSLFKLLSDTHPDSVVNLEHQYRMCEDIMTLSNSLIYKGRLRCGTEQLRFTKLDVPNMGALKQRHYDSAHLLQPSAPRSFCTGPTPGRCWIRDLLEPETRVRFINTDTLQPRTHEEAKGNRIVNPGEARVVTQLVESLVAVGVPETEIGVMTHYRSQLALLKHGLRGHPSVEMHTADRFQGRDKEVVVLSLVRSNDACAIGDLLKDWRRINVAFTRAKTKLLVVGSRETLKGAGHDEMLARFISLMESKAWVYDLPADALESHVSDDAATQASTAAALSPVKARPGFGGPVKAIGGLKGFDKENQRPEPKRAMAGETLLTKNRPITRDILNDMTNGAY
ncbi:DNA replication ATP-dependent helicase/nuclease DNA2 like protein [Verticillium longisporum]|nr:DNA replication ATP-dependent helicase/nuclease DNA2 like protein [Verticillium longisporum]